MGQLVSVAHGLMGVVVACRWQGDSVTAVSVFNPKSGAAEWYEEWYEPNSKDMADLAEANSYLVDLKFSLAGKQKCKVC